MNLFTQEFAPNELYFWEELVGNWFFWASLVFLGLELVRYLFQRRLSWGLLGDTVTNFVTLVMFLGVSLLFFSAYVGGFYLIYENFRLFEITITPWSIFLCVVLADLAYYWEHRFMHRTGVGWMTHTVHHSSPHFNISVAYRFGPLDGVMPFFFHLPLALLGFHPLLIFFAEQLVQLYQTALHTEAVGKLPKPIERVFNTPSHHRVHHGKNPQYMDKNYAGIFIVWDRLFGTFEEEKEIVVYGVTEPVNSVNPVIVFLHGFPRFFRAVRDTKGFGNKLACLWQPPGWRPRRQGDGR